MQKPQAPVKEQNAAQLAQRPQPQPLPLDEEKELLTKIELAARLKVNVRTIERWLHDGVLPQYKLGTVIRFHWPEVMARLKAKYRVASRGEAAAPEAETQIS